MLTSVPIFVRKAIVKLSPKRKFCLYGFISKLETNIICKFVGRKHKLVKTFDLTEERND